MEQLIHFLLDILSLGDYNIQSSSVGEHTDREGQDVRASLGDHYPVL